MTDQPQSASNPDWQDAVRELESEFGELSARMRQVMAARADRLQPCMLPGTYKVFTTIVKHGPITPSALAETLVADKGQVSRTVRELERSGLIERTADPADGRSARLTATPNGVERLAAARSADPHALQDRLADWDVSDIRTLTRLLRAASTRESPPRSA
ncbi:MarR family winged helix-turn-helix transcriptional regulator [Microbacterium sp. BR1]|uniref:MarR family winged helix-turn-helix transcriptional regulator n=1 Tax=Microbacterium sp. BR1 TaxID=1070896 RepID=UPI000C2C2BF1|nr:MarR family transcriptional regulator [Microbacterium sp. BR1]